MAYLFAPSAAGPELELPDFLDYIDHNLNPNDENSVLKCSEKLQGLARNRRFLAEFLIDTLTTGDTFQPNNPYAGPVILLSEGKGYAVRAVAWPPASKVDKTPSNRNTHVFADSADAMMHSHNIGILTVGYAGPGYETDLFECDYRKYSGEVGQSVELRSLGREQLQAGRCFYYRPLADAHIQYAPETYSISVNLLILPRENVLVDQSFFDPKRSEVIGVAGPGNTCRCDWLEFSRLLGESRFISVVESVSTRHPSLRVRSKASSVLRSLEERRGLDSSVALEETSQLLSTEKGEAYAD
jgi:hypothetical protein